jgi:cytochrome c-type biogenesis protein CcmH
LKQPRRYVFLALLVLAGPTVAALPANSVQVDDSQTGRPAAAQVVTQDPELEARVREIASKLRCPTCRALSVQDSPAGMAQEMRALIREQLKAGKTAEEVTAYFVDRYGEWILLKPKAQGFNWTVWLLPILILAGGLFFVFLTARRWVRQGQARAVQVEGEKEL